MADSTPSAFHVLLIGDFSGRANREINAPDDALVQQRPRQIDCDNFDDVLASSNAALDRIVVADGDQPVSIRFQELDDLHPDQLFARVELFATLRSLRQRLLNPSTFADAANEVYAWNLASRSRETKSAAEVASKTPAEAADDINASQLLDQMLEQASSIDVARPEIDFQQIIRQIVAPYMPQQIDPRQDSLVTCVDQATETLMTALIHHPHFQQLESTWRGLDYVIRHVELDTDLKLFILDVAPDELAADLLDSDGQPRPIRETRLYRTLVERTVELPGGVPWSLVGWLKPIEPQVRDVRLLEQLARSCQRGRSRLIASASGRLVGCERLSRTPDPDQWITPPGEWRQLWDTFRRSPLGCGVALLWPRFLLRLPYGAKQSPVESFAYEELKSGQDHDLLLWGNPVFLAVTAICCEFREREWEMAWCYPSDVEDLPWLVTRVDGEAVAHPCGELLITERSGVQIALLGINPIFSFPNRDAMRLPELMSIGRTDWAWPD